MITRRSILAASSSSLLFGADFEAGDQARETCDA